MKSFSNTTKEVHNGETVTDENQEFPTTPAQIDSELDMFLENEDIMYYSRSYMLAQQDLISEEMASHPKLYSKLLPKKAVEKLLKSLPDNINHLILSELVQFILAEWGKNFVPKKDASKIKKPIFM
jgi:hypothetical protein